MKYYIQTEHRVISVNLRKDAIANGIYWTPRLGNCYAFKNEKDAIEKAEKYLKDYIKYHRTEANRYLRMLKEGIKVE